MSRSPLLPPLLGVPGGIVFGNVDGWPFSTAVPLFSIENFCRYFKVFAAITLSE